VGRLARPGEGLRGESPRCSLPLRPLPLGDGQDRSRLARCLGNARRLGGDHLRAAPRGARLTCDLQAPLGVGEERRHRRPDLERRPDRTRDGCRLAGGRARGIRLPVSSDRRPLPDVRGADRDRPAPVGGGDARFRGRALHAQRQRPAEAALPAQPDRRRPREAPQSEIGRPLGRRVRNARRRSPRSSRLGRKQDVRSR
jgi:hypothetical protein